MNVYLGVTLDRTLSYRQHLQKTAAEVKTRNNLLSKLAGSTWGANATTLRTCALALCYSAAEYCCPVWSRSGPHRPGWRTTEFFHAANIRHPTSYTGSLASSAQQHKPPNIRRKAACDKLLQVAEAHPDWPVYQDFFNHPSPRLPCRKPICSDLAPTDAVSRWRADWQSASVTNNHLIPDPTVRLPGFDLSRLTSSMLNRFRTGQGRCAANLYKWHIASTDKCEYRRWGIVDTCPLFRFVDGYLSRLHSVDDFTIAWLQSVAVKAFAN